MRRIAALLCTAGFAFAQDERLTLTLEDALRLAVGKSEQVAIAEAGLRRAEAEQDRARSQFLPQLNSFAAYTRTLATEFSSLFNRPAAPPCAPLSANPASSLAERISELERFLLCGGPAASPFGGAGGGQLPFGRTNIWNLGLSAQQPLFAGGRLVAQRRLAAEGRAIAAIQLDSTNAQFTLDVTQAFYDTALAHRLLEIAQENLNEASRTLEFTRLGFEVGRLPEFDVLRAEVTRRNQVPEVARRRAALEQSGLRLRQLLEIPLETDLVIADELGRDPLRVPEPFAKPLQAAERAPVQQARAVLRQREANVDIARSQRLPAVNFGSDYGLVAYPSGFFPTSTNQFRNNWTLGFSVSLPLFTGGRIRAEIDAAATLVTEARAQLKLTQELALLDTSVVRNQLRTAEDEWQSSIGTVDQATRAFEIARLRYTQGISNQLELDDARIALLEARANRARAARDLQVTRAIMALLPLLPVSNVPQVPGQPLIPIRNQTQPGPASQTLDANQIPNRQQPAGAIGVPGRRF